MNKFNSQNSIHPRILLVQIGLNGDCLLATVIARQIKEIDYPNSHLTWAVGSSYRQTIFMNPHVDDIWEIANEKCLTNPDEWKYFLSEVEEAKNSGRFDLVFISQGLGENWLKFDGGLRSSAYNNYPHKITVSPKPVIRLSDSEVENVKRFAKARELEKYKNVILVEYSPTSFDSDLNQKSGCKFAADFAAENEDTAIILSSNKSFASPLKNVIDASSLSFRENAELSKYCDLFVGCGSGISWLMASDWSKKLNTVLLINQSNGILPSLQYDHQHINLPADHIIEIKNGGDSLEKLKKCLDKILSSDFAQARKRFNEKIAVINHDFLYQQIYCALEKADWKNYFSSFRRYFKRNGIFSGKNIGLRGAAKIIFITLKGLAIILKRKFTKIFGRNQALSADKLLYSQIQKPFDEK